MSVTDKFKEMGARVKVYPPTKEQSRWSSGQELRIDVDEDKFDIRSEVPLVVLDVDKKDRHLVLMARMPNGDKPKFLCGFDERGWFAAPLPEPQHVKWHRGEKPSTRRGISDVASAKASLKPPEVIEAEGRLRLKPRKRSGRVNAASKRQGEWFFVPDRKLQVDDELVLKNEPIQMGGKRQHICAEVFRSGGETVWVNSKNPNGMPDAEYKALDQKERQSGYFRRMVRDASVYARGKVSAPDHAPLHLDGWHKVIPNTESRARHAPKVAFLD